MAKVISLEKNIVYISGNFTRNEIKLAKQNTYPANLNFSSAHNKAADIAAALTNTVTQNKLKGKRISLVLPTKLAIYRELEIPPVKNPRRALEVIKNSARSTISNIDDYILDYIELYKSPNGTSVIQLSAILQKQLDEYFEAFRTFGITCEKVDLVTNSLSKLTSAYYGSEKLVVLVRVNAESVDLAVIVDGVCLLPRSFNLSATRFKALDTMDIMAQEIAAHINESIQSLSGQRIDRSGAKVLLMCDFDDSDKFAEDMKASLTVPCESFSAAKNAKNSRKLCVYAAAIGAMIRR